MFEIRYAVETDVDTIVEIENHYIAHSHSTFDINPKTVEEKTQWFFKYRSTGPYRLLVATEKSKVIGFCYSSRYRDHFAFNQTVETSIYIDPSNQAKGVGTALYKMLFEELKFESLHLAVCGIALPNEASIRLHKKFGFTEVGIFKDYAVKNGKYLSSIWLQKELK